MSEDSDLTLEEKLRIAKLIGDQTRVEKLETLIERDRLEEEGYKQNHEFVGGNSDVYAGEERDEFAYQQAKKKEGNVRAARKKLWEQIGVKYGIEYQLGELIEPLGETSVQYEKISQTNRELIENLFSSKYYMRSQQKERENALNPEKVDEIHEIIDQLSNDPNALEYVVDKIFRDLNENLQELKNSKEILDKKLFTGKMKTYLTIITAIIDKGYNLDKFKLVDNIHDDETVHHGSKDKIPMIIALHKLPGILRMYGGIPYQTKADMKIIDSAKGDGSYIDLEESVSRMIKAIATDRTTLEVANQQEHSVGEFEEYAGETASREAEKVLMGEKEIEKQGLNLGDEPTTKNDDSYII